VADYVGLKVNVTDTTRAAFMKNMTRILSENVVRSLLKEDGDA
jgi:hypothetical protein